MTIRLVVLWSFLGVLAAFGLYTVKYRVQALKTEVASTETQLREARKNLHVLTAEWTYLNRPERLRQLSARFLKVEPVRGAQLADFATLPAAVAPGSIQPASDTEGSAPLGHGVTLASGALHAR